MSTSLDISFSGKPFAPINVPGLKFDMIPNTLLTKSPNKWLSPNEIKSLERLIKFGYISRNVHPNLLPVSSNSYGSAFTIKLKPKLLPFSVENLLALNNKQLKTKESTTICVQPTTQSIFPDSPSILDNLYATFLPGEPTSSSRETIKIPAALFTACQESFEFSNSPLCEVIKIEDSKQKADNVLPGPMDKFKISIPTDLEREEFKKTKKPRFRKTSVSLLKKVLLSNLLKSHTANPKRLGISVAASKRALTGAKRKLKKNRHTSSKNGKKKSDVIEQTCATSPPNNSSQTNDVSEK